MNKNMINGLTACVIIGVLAKLTSTIFPLNCPINNFNKINIKSKMTLHTV